MSRFRPPIPVMIIGGFLGAGKTTLLNHLLRGGHGLRIAVLVNDFGSINIDAEMVATREGETISLANGCICCSIGGSLLMALLRLLERPVAPEHLIIEASGVADPWKIAQIGLAGGSFRLDGIIVVADAETVREKAGDKYVGGMVVRQLAVADLVVLNKVDLVGDQQRADVRGWIQGLLPQARIIEAVQAQVPLEFLVGIGNTRTTAGALGGPSHDHCGHGYGHDHGRAFSTWDFVADRPFDREALCRVVDALPVSIIRAKGVLLLDEDPTRRAIFQMVGKRRNLTWGEPWGEARPGTRLVLIGLPRAVEGEMLTAQFTRALAGR